MVVLVGSEWFVMVDWLNLVWLKNLKLDSSNLQNLSLLMESACFGIDWVTGLFDSVADFLHQENGVQNQ